MQSMKSKFESTCKVCGTKIKTGETIYKLNDHWCKNLDCGSEKIPKVKPKDQSTLEQKPQAKEFKTSQIPTEVKDTHFIPGSPHEEAELIDRWAKERAWKITMEDYSNFNDLSSDKQRGLGIEANMREKILVNAVLKLYEIWGIKR